MFSEDDVNVLKDKLAVSVKKKEDLVRKIAEEMKKNEEIAILKNYISSNQDDIEIQENLLIQEKQLIKEEINRVSKELGSTMITDDLLTEAENRLANHVEAFEYVQNDYLNIFRGFENLRLQESYIDPELVKNSKEVSMLEKLLARIPPLVPISLQMNDLIGQIEHLKGKKRNDRSIAAKMSSLEEIKNDINQKTAEYENLSQKLREKNLNIEEAQTNLSDQTKQLSRLEFSMFSKEKQSKDELSTLCTQESDHSDAENSALVEIEELKTKLQDMKSQLNALPASIKVYKDESSRKLAKKRNLVEQLEKKLQDIRQQITSDGSIVFKVADLTKGIEEHYVSKQKMLDDIQNKTKTLKKLENEVERKRVLKSELLLIMQSTAAPSSSTGINFIQELLKEQQLKYYSLSSTIVDLQDQLEGFSEEYKTMSAIVSSMASFVPPRSEK